MLAPSDVRIGPAGTGHGRVSVGREVSGACSETRNEFGADRTSGCGDIWLAGVLGRLRSVIFVGANDPLHTLCVPSPMCTPTCTQGLGEIANDPSMQDKIVDFRDHGFTHFPCETAERIQSAQVWG